MYYSSSQIAKAANRVVRECGTRDPHLIVKRLGIELITCDFNEQKGAYKVILRRRFIFLNKNLSPLMERIVLLHELGHDALHRYEATHDSFHEFNLFDMQNNRMEYEANMFAAELSLPDDEFLKYVIMGYDVSAIASAMNSDINLVALKAARLNSLGYNFNNQEYKSDYLRK